MPISANIITDFKGNIVLRMNGYLDFETNLLIEKEISKILRNHANSYLTLDFQSVDFVGSSSISSFVNIVKKINQPIIRVKICNVKSEFQKVFRLYHRNFDNYIIKPLELNISGTI